jgi:hypothetical protein
MTIIKNHFEVFILTSKKQGNSIIESKVGLYSIKKGQFTHICQLNVSYGQDSVFGIVLVSCTWCASSSNLVGVEESIVNAPHFLRCLCFNSAD